MTRTSSESIYPHSKEHTRNSLYLALPVILFIGLQTLRIVFSSPEIDVHGDPSLKWDLARNLVHGEGLKFNPENHHCLRWAGWLLPYILIMVFGDHLAVYLLSTIIPSTIAGCIFISLITRTLSISFGILFSLLWMIDPLLYTATFSLLPEGSTLLPLSILIVFLVKLLKEENINSLDSIFLAVICFWLYGVKETNLFFVLGAIYLLFRFSPKKNIVVFLLFGFSLYIIETIALWHFGGMHHYFGRIYELIFASAKHLNIMSGERITGELIGFYDRGISYRFYSGTAFHSTMYLAAAAIALIKVFEQDIITTIDKTLLVVGCIYLSFFFTTGFFVINLDPIMPGQPLRSRYLTPMIPLAIILISIGVFKLVSSKPKVIVIAIIAITWFWISIPMNWAAKKYTAPYKNITSMNQHYSSFADSVETSDCVYSKVKGDLVFIHRWPPLSSRGEKYKAYAKSKIKKRAGMYVKKFASTCINNLTLNGQYFKKEY